MTEICSRCTKSDRTKIEYEDMLIETWASIAEFLGISRRSVMYRRKRMIRDGYVFYRKRRRFEAEVACAWASSLKLYVQNRGLPKKNA